MSRLEPASNRTEQNRAEQSQDHTLSHHNRVGGRERERESEIKKEMKIDRVRDGENWT